MNIIPLDYSLAKPVSGTGTSIDDVLENLVKRMIDFGTPRKMAEDILVRTIVKLSNDGIIAKIPSEKASSSDVDNWVSMYLPILESRFEDAGLIGIV